MVNAALKELGARFDELNASGGRPSIAPEKLLRALLLQVLYTVRSERMLMEQLDYNFLFRWFVGLSIDDPVWDVTVFTKNRERRLKGEVAQGFFHAVVEQARAQGLLSDEHFTVDGTLIEAWAGHKSFKRKADERQTPPDDPGNPSVDFHGERRRNATHQSTTDPEARLTQASGRAEPEAALAMVEEIAGFGRVTLGADKGYDQKELVRELREHRVTPHVAQKPNSAIDRRTTRRPGYLLSQRRRKRVEEIFGWLKTVGGLRKTRYRGVARVGWTFTFAATAYNLVRMRNLNPVVT